MPKTAKPSANTINLGSIGTIVTAKAPKKAGNPERVMSGVTDFTASDRVIADLEDARAVAYEKLSADARTMFLNDGCATKMRPGNFKGIEIEVVDGTSLTNTVSCELRVYGHPLSEAAQKIAVEHKIPVSEEVITHETYIINPALAANMAIMQVVVDVLNAGMPKIAAAMTKAGLENVEILQKQSGSTKTVTNDETLPALFKLPREVAEIALPVFTTLSVGKGKYASLPGQENDLSRALLHTAKLINRPGFRDEMQGMAEKRKAEKAERSRKRAA